MTDGYDPFRGLHFFLFSNVTLGPYFLSWVIESFLSITHPQLLSSTSFLLFGRSCLIVGHHRLTVECFPSGCHVYRLPRCIRHHQPPLPGRVLDSCRSISQDPPHSEGPLRGSNRDGASALTERRDSVFRAVSCQSKAPSRATSSACSVLRSGWIAFSGCTTSLARALAAPPCVT